MTLSFLFPSLIAIMSGVPSAPAPAPAPAPGAVIDNCDIVEFYERMDLSYGSKVIGSYGGVEDAGGVLVPTEVEIGNYEVTVRRIDQNFYQIAGTSIVIETSYCMEYAAYGSDAIMMVESNYGYTKGTIIFD